MIEVKITGDSAEDIKKEITQLAGLFGGEAPETATKTATRTRTTASAKKKAEEEEEEEKAPAKSKADKSDAITLDAIRTAVSEKVEEDDDNSDLIKAILKKFGASKLSELEEDDYAAVLKAVNKL